MELLIIIVAVILLQTSYLTYKTLKPFKGTTLHNATFIDTSVLMDGRITTAARTGFIPSVLVVPLSVISELHLLSDQADPDKRHRARHGLDVVAELQALPYVTVVMHDDGSAASGVDQRLIELAKRYDGSICTIDFNLNKVASVQGIRVLNLNELAGNIRMAYLPGESFSLMLTQKGQDNAQAVGYLVDGTMVVVDNAAARIGEMVEVEATRSLQTTAGRMIFARLTKANPISSKPEPAKVTRNVDKVVGRKRVSTKSQEGSEVVDSQRQHTRKRKPNVRSTKAGTEDSLINLVNDQ